MAIVLRLRRTAATIISAVILVLVGTSFAHAQTGGAASPAARFAAMATPHQNSVIAWAMTRVPGGTRVGPGEVTWPVGVVFKVTNAGPNAVSTCQSDYFCEYPLTNYNCADGCLSAVDESQAGGSYWIPYGSFYPAVHSWDNESFHRTWLEQFQNHGNELCITAITSDPNYQGVNDHDYWTLMSANPNVC